MGRARPSRKLVAPHQEIGRARREEAVPAKANLVEGSASVPCDGPKVGGAEGGVAATAEASVDAAGGCPWPCRGAAPSLLGGLERW